jgi:hypothetical protein
MTTPAPTPGQTSISSSAGPATSTGPPQASGPSAPADRASHLSLILDLSPIQWALSSADPSSPLSLSTFLAHLFAFLNAHLAAKAENSLSVFGALPGRSAMLYSSSPASSSSTGSRLRVSSEATHGVDVPPPDANSYQPFKVVNSSVSSRIASELSSLTDFEEERKSFPFPEPLCLMLGSDACTCIFRSYHKISHHLSNMKSESHVP